MERQLTQSREPSQVEVVRVDGSTMALLDVVSENVFDESIAPDRLARFLDTDLHLLVVAVAEGTVVGQARGIIHLSPDQPDELYVDNMGVAPDWRRRGVGGRLLDELLAWGREHGCEYAWLGTEHENTATRALYSGRGGKQSSIIMFEYEIEGGQR